MENLVNPIYFNDVYRNKKVLITGNTGFKGSWLSLWLNLLGAKVYGISIDDKNNSTLFDDQVFSDLGIKTYYQDIRNLNQISIIVDEIQPDYIFHLAAQAIVSDSYINPINTITTNVIGTANILEICRKQLLNCVVVIITSDKCYENLEWLWGYREIDKLGGKDIYSSSKACAENIFYSYFNSFFKSNECVKIASARAGNVIGGGDWSENRIIPDCYRSWYSGKPVIIRNPNSTRPWQHVLEPLSGYLHLAYTLSVNQKISGEAFNFGPNDLAPKSVSSLVSDLYSYEFEENNFQIFDYDKNIHFEEANLLKLNCDKANQILNWTPVLSYDELIKFTADWYINNKKGNNSIKFTLNQIFDYIFLARKKRMIWTQNI
jgi:CDP-glucose 4,6-dehydratase